MTRYFLDRPTSRARKKPDEPVLQTGLAATDVGVLRIPHPLWYPWMDLTGLCAWQPGPRTAQAIAGACAAIRIAGTIGLVHPNRVD